jgi:cyanophycinase
VEKDVELFLIGGGWSEAARELVYGPFLSAAARRGGEPTVACLVLDEGDGPEQFARWQAALQATSPCSPVPVLVPEGGRLDVAALPAGDALLVCGGLTPAYAAALSPVAAALRGWLAEGARPYAGFSAGAAVAAERAVVGGWLREGRPVCPEDAAEDLEEVELVAGLGFVPFAVDVHAAQWGTLGRLVTAVGAGLVPAGVALDEGALLTVRGALVEVGGTGRAHLVQPAPDGGALVRSLAAGQRIAGLLPG